MHVQYVSDVYMISEQHNLVIYLATFYSFW